MKTENEQLEAISDMPFFRMTDPATGISGLLKVEKDANGKWTIPDPELRKKFAEQCLRSADQENDKPQP